MLKLNYNYLKKKKNTKIHTLKSISGALSEKRSFERSP